MKKIFFSLLMAIMFVSCGDKNAYTISGTLTDVADGIQVSLSSDRRGKDILETTVVKDGKFAFTGQQIDPVVKFVKIEGEGIPNQRPYPVVIEPGAKINIKIDSEGRVDGVTGTPLNDKNTEFWSSLGSKNAPDSELILFVKENANNVLGVYLLEANAYAFDLDGLKEAFTLVPDKFKSTPEMVKIRKNIEAQESTAIGNKFIDIKGLTPEGKELALSDYAGKGKIVLVDFWASWCPPCIGDMPFLVDAYAKYKDKGFEIVGVSIDHENDKWISRIKELNITWPQMSDLKGWESELSKPYAVSSIPYTVLLDKDGTIIAKKVNGDNLDETLAKLLK